MVRTTLTDAYVIRHCPLYQPLNEAREAMTSQKILKKHLKIEMPTSKYSTPARPINAVALQQAIHNVREAMGVSEEPEIQIDEGEREELADEVMDEAPQHFTAAHLSVAAVFHQPESEASIERREVRQQHRQDSYRSTPTLRSASSETAEQQALRRQGLMEQRRRYPGGTRGTMNPATREDNRAYTGGNIPAQRQRRDEGGEHHPHFDPTFHPGRGSRHLPF